MSTLSVVMAIGYFLLGIAMVVGSNYMDAFVAFTISAIFIFGLLDIFSAKKRGTAHILTGGLVSAIFSVYYAIEYLSQGLEGLISSGKWNLDDTITFIVVVILGAGGVFCFVLSKKIFKKSAKIESGRR